MAFNRFWYLVCFEDPETGAGARCQSIASVEHALGARQRVITTGPVNLNAIGDAVIPVGFARYRVEGLTGYQPSGAVGAQAKIALFTGPGGTGTELFGATGVALDVNGIRDYTVDLTDRNTVQTAPVLYLRCVQAFGAALTASFYLSVVDLT